MTPEEHLRILGSDTLAEIRRHAADAPTPTPEQIDVLRAILAPAAARLRHRASQAAQLHAAEAATTPSSREPQALEPRLAA